MEEQKGRLCRIELVKNTEYSKLPEKKVLIIRLISAIQMYEYTRKLYLKTVLKFLYLHSTYIEF